LLQHRQALQSILQECFADRPYQVDWLLQILGQGASGRVAILGGRQIGKDYVALSFVAAWRMCTIEDHVVNVVSATDKHAMQMVKDVKRWIYLLQYVFDLGIDPRNDSKKEFRLVNGSVLYSHAGTVRAIVGQRGDIYLNEIGVRDPKTAKELIEAAGPIHDGAMDQGKPSLWMITSNATRRGHPWHTFWTTEESDDFVKIKSTWSDCMRSMGRSDKWIAQVREARIKRYGLGAFLQWYECVWRSESEGFLPAKLMQQHQYHTLPPTVMQPGNTQYIGYDVGRINDPSAFARTIRQDQGLLWALPTEARHSMRYKAQRDHIQGLIDRANTSGVSTNRIEIDATGIGHEPAECSEERWPGIARGHVINAQTKLAMFNRLKATIEAGKLYLPAGDIDLMMELESIELEPRDHTADRIVLPRENGKHCDRAFALALSVWGATDPTSNYWDALGRGLV